MAEERVTAPAATIRLLGRYAIDGAGQTTIIGRPRDAWLLLGLLLEYRHAPLQREVVVRKMWPDQDPGVCSTRFWEALKRTRITLCKALDRPTDHGKYVVQHIGSGGYRLNMGLFRADLWQLRDALVGAEQGTQDERRVALETAVAYYTGPFLPDAEHEWAVSAARAVDRDVVRALTRLADLEKNQEQVAYWLESATAIDPAGEHLFRRRMRAYADLGRHQAVHDCYAELLEHLRSVGDRPDQRTNRLYQELAALGD